MPLPYAPPPKESKVYTDLKNLKITGVTADQLDTLKGVLFAQGVDGSEDEMRRLKLLGEVSNQQSSSGPIPGTMKVVDETWTATGTKTFGQPGQGETWQILAGSTQTVNSSGNNTFYPAIGDVDSGVAVRISDGETVTANQKIIEPHGALGALYLDENMQFSVYFSAFAADSVQLKFLLIRVR